VKKAAKSPRKTTYATPALEKGLDVLELLAHQPSGLTKSEIAARLQRTMPEIFRMLVCLEQRGYITEIESDRFALSLKLFRLAQEHPPTERLITQALPIMQQTAHVTQQSCHLAIVEDGRVIIVAQVNAPTASGFYVKLGSVIDLMKAASGYVILAHQDEEHRRRTLEAWSRRTDDPAPTDLASHLKRIRKTGFERRASYQVKGVSNISFPIVNAFGNAIGALTMPYLQYEYGSPSIDAATGELRKAALAISRAIGGRPEVQKDSRSF